MTSQTLRAKRFSGHFRTPVVCILFLLVPARSVVWPVGANASDSNFTYRSLIVSEPENNSAFWSAAGIVTIKVDAQPPYNPHGEDTLLVYMDNVFVGVGPMVQLSEVDRGTHSAYAVIVDEQGRQLIKSSIIHFTLHKPSIFLQHRK